jgi:hypothetical protein
MGNEISATCFNEISAIELMRPIALERMLPSQSSMFSVTGRSLILPLMLVMNAVAKHDGDVKGIFDALMLWNTPVKVSFPLASRIAESEKMMAGDIAGSFIR